MQRRTALLGLMALSTGCVGRAKDRLPSVASSTTNTRELGESISSEDITITVTDSRTATRIRCAIAGDRDQETFPTIEPPDNASLWLANVSVANDDIETRTIPTFAPGNYQDTSLNDIIVYGDDEKGVAEASMPLDFGYTQLLVDGETLHPYPPSPLTEDVDPNSTLSGWVFGVIEEDSQPQLRIDAFGEAHYWRLED